MEDWNGIFNKSSGLGEFRSTSSSTRDDHHDQDFDEEDVWGTISMSHESPTNMKKLITSKTSPTPRSIPRRANTSEAKVGKLVQQSSAPMKIPDWSKIYGKTTSSNIARNNIVNGFNHGCDHHDNIVGYDDHHDHADDADDDDDDDDDMVPPHEWIARKLARSQISSFSVCEGIGRTLKGRDLSKVRNAILTKTGFLE